MQQTYMEDELDTPVRDLLQIMQERIVTKTTYFGVPAIKRPIDFWIYQEIIFELKPDVIIEIGNRFGGSTLALAHQCDLLGHGYVIGLDITHQHIYPVVRNHPRVTLVEGDACSSFIKVREQIPKDASVLVIKDSAHTYENTLNVLNTYSPLIKSGGYFIIEDGICHHGLEVGPNPGPYEAIEAFLDGNTAFEADRNREAFLITWNPKGYIRHKS